MSEAVNRLRKEVESIARSASPNLTYASVSPYGLPHSATTWFAPTEELGLLTISAPTRIHTQYIEACIARGIPALVSGGMHTEGQQKSQPDQHGVTFEGIASRLSDEDQIRLAIGTFLLYETFQEEELSRYLHQPTSEVPAHGIYLLQPTRWTIFDGRLGSTNPERLVRIDWPVEPALQ